MYVLTVIFAGGFMLRRLVYPGLILLCSYSMSALAQDGPPAIETQALTDNISVISGAGGNIAVFSGDDGVFVIDNGMPNVIDAVAKSIELVAAQPVRMIFNTHWHFDHVGGNEYYGEQGTLIVAHDNVRKRMSASSFSKFINAEMPASPTAALPVVTFATTANFYLNGEHIIAQHVPFAHTDGDAILRFENANIVHLGDLFFNGLYPVIDVSAGGSIGGMIAAVDKILPTLNESTRIIPGHGPLAGMAELRAFRDMLSTVERRVRLLIDEGKTAEQVIAIRPSINFDEQWAWDFMPADRWIGIVYDSMVSQAEIDGAADVEDTDAE
jgi:glyoxylase-like metal-dependent hydrolase (beta-lactamase superfamily II)